MSKLTDQLTNYIQNNKFDQFFDEVTAHLTDGSDLQDLVTLLEKRFVQLKTDIIIGILSKEEEQTQRNTLAKDLLAMLTLADDDDFIKEEIKKSVAYFYQTIAAKQKELENITNQRVEGIYKAGNALSKLGEVLSGKKDETDQSIPFDQILKSAFRKAHRRVAIGCKELEEVKLFQNKAFKEIIELYRELVLYMDFPDEDVDDAKIALLKQNFSDVRRFSQNLKTTKGQPAAHLKNTLPGIQQLIEAKPHFLQELTQGVKDPAALIESLNETFNSLVAIKLELTNTINFFDQDEINNDQLVAQLNNLLSELELSIKEQ